MLWSQFSQWLAIMNSGNENCTELCQLYDRRKRCRAHNPGAVGLCARTPGENRWVERRRWAQTAAGFADGTFEERSRDPRKYSLNFFGNVAKFFDSGLWVARIAIYNAEIGGYLQWDEVYDPLRQWDKTIQYIFNIFCNMVSIIQSINEFNSSTIYWLALLPQMSLNQALQASECNQLSAHNFV